MSRCHAGCMNIAVLGATGTIGRRIADLAEAEGHTVKRVSRAAGIDITTSRGVEQAVAGSEVVIDALNSMTLSRRKAVSWFEDIAEQVANAAAGSGVRRIVCVSIYGVQNPAVARGYGYYAGKAAQAQAYRNGPVPVTVVESTQWFELLPAVLKMASAGPVAVLPTMRMALVSADSVARLVVEEAARPFAPDSNQDREISIRGAQELETRQAVNIWLHEAGDVAGQRPRLVLQAPYFGAAIASGGLIPTGGLVEDQTLQEWIQAGGHLS